MGCHDVTHIVSKMPLTRYAYTVVKGVSGLYSRPTRPNFADDIALRSSKFNDLHEKTGRLAEEAARVGLKHNARKCKTLKTEFASNKESIMMNGEEVEDGEEFEYLGEVEGHGAF